MEPIELPPDFSEFLRLLNEHDVDYLLVGGYAVAVHGYPRATADIDVWVASRGEFGFDVPALTEDSFTSPDCESCGWACHRCGSNC